MGLVFAIDIDGILCSISQKHYNECVPNIKAIATVNRLYDEGHTIKIFTARGSRSGTDWRGFTIQQLDSWGVKYHELIFGKPHADVFIDDKFSKSLAEYVAPVVVATSGYFDPIHIGHLELFRRSREYGSKLVVILGNDEALVRKKGYVFMSQEERIEILKSIKYVDEVILSIDDDGTANRTLRLLRPDVYTKGGSSKGTKETLTCEEIGCKLVSGLGDKIRSSSGIVGRFRGEG